MDRLRQIPSFTGKGRFTLRFRGEIHVTAVATSVRGIASDPKVRGSIPGGCSGGHHYKNSVGKHATGNYTRGI